MLPIHDISMTQITQMRNRSYNILSFLECIAIIPYIMIYKNNNCFSFCDIQTYTHSLQTFVHNNFGCNFTS